MKEVGYIAVVLCVCFHVSCEIHRDARTDRQIHSLEMELSRLRMIQQEDKQKQRLLENEIGRYHNVIQGLESLCRGLKHDILAHAPVNGNGHQQTDHVIDGEQTKPLGITVHSVDAIRHDGLKITVNYFTSEHHNIIWAYNVLGQMIPVLEGDPYAAVKTDISDNSGKTSLTIDPNRLFDFELLYMKVLSEFSELTIVFNKTTILEGGSEVISPTKLAVQSPETVIADGIFNLTISASIENINNEEMYEFANFIGIDTSTDDPKLLDLQSLDPRIGSHVINTTTGYEWTIKLDTYLVSLGGILTLRVMQRKTHGLVAQVHVGKTVYIVSKPSDLYKAPFQRSTVAFLPLYKYAKNKIRVKPPIGALWCYAFGNPAPRSIISKINDDGTRSTLIGHEFKIGKYDSAQVIVFHNVSSRVAGRYICNAYADASSVSEIVEVVVEV